MRNINWKNVCKKVCDFTVTTFTLGLAYSFMFPSSRKNNCMTNDYDTFTANYTKAVEAIVQSDMLDSYKSDAVEMLKRNGDADYYKAVINIVNSDMLDSYKSDVLEKLSEAF